jgi:hypothetical protein
MSTGISISEIHRASQARSLITVIGDARQKTFCVALAKTMAVAVAATSLATLLALVGCASAPIPTEQFAVSKTAIDSATTAGATEYAPLEIKTARDKLDAAQRAVDEKEYRKSAALAEEAQVDAKLAETKALSAKAKKSVAETQDNLRTLLEEVNRNTKQDMQRNTNP